MPNRNNHYNMLIKHYIGRIIVSNGRSWYRGQVLLEYAVVLVLVVTALISLQLYLQRGLQARYKDASDKALREIRQAGAGLNLPLQYEPYYQDSDITTESDSHINRSYTSEGATNTVINQDRTLRTGRRAELPYSDGAGE